MQGNKISDLLLERYLLKELPQDKMGEIEALIEEDSNLRERLKKLEESNKEIIREYPAEYMSGEIKKRHDKQKASGAVPASRPSRYRKALFPSLAMAAAALIFLVVFPMGDNYNNLFDEGINEVTRLKGSGKLYLFRKTGEKIERLKDRARAEENDLLQLAYMSGNQKYGVILSIDGRGQVTLHYPEKTNSSTKLKTGKRVLLSASYELDDAPRFERFIFLTSKSLLKAGPVMQAAQTLAANPEEAMKRDLKLAKEVKQISLIVLKGEK